VTPLFLADVAGRFFLDPVLSVVFPLECAACGEAVSRPTRGPLCGACWTALPRHQGALCGCGFPLATPGPCGRCRRGLSLLSRGASLGPYEGSLRVAIHELKFRGRQRVARRLAEELVGSGHVASVVEGADALIPVPLHPRRLGERGFNQAELLARAVARAVRLPVWNHVLVRRDDTRPQTGLSASGRRANVARAFIVHRRGRVAGRVLVLVDDVTTTGATAHACAAKLRECGARDVRLLSAARVS
jgi:competence protein ComFC